MLYSEKVMDHLAHPRNVGEMENADAIGEVGNMKCGDIMKIYLKIDDSRRQISDLWLRRRRGHLFHGHRDD